MKEEFNVQFAAKSLLEDVDETSVSSGAGAYLAKGGYKKHSDERTTGGMIYKDLWEEEDAQPDDRIVVTAQNEYKGRSGTVIDVVRGFLVVKIDGESGKHSMHMSDVKKIKDETEEDEEDLNEVFTREDYEKAQNLLKKIENLNPKIYRAIERVFLSAAIDPYSNTTYSDLETMANGSQLAENYSRFKNETKTRSKPDQFHQAIREVKKRVQEIHKVFEYVNRLKEELNESGDSLKYKKHTEAAVSKIKEMVSELNVKMKRFK